MSRQSTHIYRQFVRSKVKEPFVKERKLTAEQILSLRYQCALENNDFEMAKALKILMPSQGEQHQVSQARQKAEALFSR